ncbi:BAX inhibitor protein [Betaproteobacteria bacterium]|nr:BAX inhibitor protein [Betaproteobacteria bacterium]GHU47235.1 BAX inhibitor protein [Betaproteobacteria bacterium]
MSIDERSYIQTAGAKNSDLAQGSLAARKVLRNTYLLLAMTLAFSAFVAGVAATTGAKPLGLIVTLVGYFGLLFAVTKFRNSGVGVALVFALTGFMGYTLGPLIGFYLQTPGGSSIVMTALGGTAVVFFVMSAIAVTTKKDLSFMGSFLAIGILVAFLAGLGAIAFNLPMLSLAVSAAFVLLASGLILFETNNIIRGGETNYVMATVTLYVSLYNLFVSLMHILGAFSGDD